MCGNTTHTPASFRAGVWVRKENLAEVLSVLQPEQEAWTSSASKPQVRGLEMEIWLDSREGESLAVRERVGV